jgi:hypothetical protein
MLKGLEEDSEKKPSKPEVDKKASDDDFGESFVKGVLDNKGHSYKKKERESLAPSERLEEL